MKPSLPSLAALALFLPPAVTAQHKPFVDSETIQSLIDESSLLSGAQTLHDIAAAHDGHRAFGTAGHNATVDFLYTSLTDLDYYTVTKQTFTAPYIGGNVSLTIDGAPLPVGIMMHGPTSSQTRGPLIAVPDHGCKADTYAQAGDVTDKIALVARGGCTFATKAAQAKAAGAKAVVVYNTQPARGVVTGTLGAPSAAHAVVVGISMEEGEKALARLGKGEEVLADIEVTIVFENRTTVNVLAETRDGDHGNVLVVGGHSDSVPAGPGVNDNGSGTIGILEVAKALSRFDVKNAVRFAWFSAEEFGLLGSAAYVRSLNGTETEMGKMRAYLNFDMIASPNYVYGIYDGDGSAFGLTGPAGSGAIEKRFEDFFKGKGVASVPSAFSGRSDYAPFIANGIPSGGLFTGAEDRKTEYEVSLFGGEAGVPYDAHYHARGDTVDNLAMDAFLLNTQAIADSVAAYAMSFDDLPSGDGVEKGWVADRAVFTKREAQGLHAHAEHAHDGPCGGFLDRF
ncbi:hypothetical protein B0T19DRAFT_486985 [Cercophora scortea]|uniref:Peptide hydrolase n=1 Tax=Cercophora scortea TaxID=314031 RepID=A0AAE0M5W9_9PEZI|nr:hypothetical protein B0T19DRAFT_486985 [Cercophora scortea]